MLQVGDLVVGEDVTLEVPSMEKRYKTTIVYLDRRFAYVQPPLDESGALVALEPGIEVNLIVTGFGAMHVHPTTLHHWEDEQNPPRLVLDRTGPPERMETRSTLRLNVQIKAELRLLAADGSIKSVKQGEFQDMSAGGGRVRLDEPLPRDTDVEVSFTLPGTTQLVETPGKVARVFPVIRRGVHELGIQFLPTAASVGDTITRWILDQQRRRAVR